MSHRHTSSKRSKVYDFRYIYVDENFQKDEGKQAATDSISLKKIGRLAATHYFSLAEKTATMEDEKMNKRARQLFAVAILAMATLALSSCTKMYVVVDEPRPTAAPAADTARIYFMLPQNFPGGRAWVLEDDNLIGYVQNRQYFMHEVPAGEHLFMLVSENTEGLKGQFEGGKTYYVRMFITPGIMGTRVYWAVLEDGKENWDKRYEWLDACRQVTLNPGKANKWESKYAGKNAERLAKYTSGESEPATFGPAAGE